MPPKRQPLADLTNLQPPSKQAKTTTAATTAASSSSISTRKPDSKTEAQLRLLTPQQAQETLERLLNSYEDKSGSGYLGAEFKANGCKIAQKGVNREDNGYIQIAPISAGTRAGTSNGIVKDKPAPQNAHRLVIWAHGTEEDRQNLLDNRWHASHLCHTPRCIAEEHLVVEPKEKNELRKRCAKELWMIEVMVDGALIKITSNYQCPCEGLKCIPKQLDGHVI